MGAQPRGTAPWETRCCRAGFLLKRQLCAPAWNGRCLRWMNRRGSNQSCQKRFVVAGLWKFPQSCPWHVVRVCLHASKEISGVGAGCHNCSVCCAYSRRPRSCETAPGRPLLLSRERALEQPKQLPLLWWGLHRAKQKFPGEDPAKINSGSLSR